LIYKSSQKVHPFKSYKAKTQVTFYLIYLLNLFKLGLSTR